MNKKSLQKFEQECSTVWSFPRRGKRATHNSKYRGNRSPEIVRNLILRYSEEGDQLLDPMIGGGTTAIEAKILNRNLIAYDINPDAIELTKQYLDFEVENNAKIKVELNDSTKRFKKIKENSIDFILTHPPYLNIIKYSEGIEGDVSLIKDQEIFYKKIENMAKEFYRILKPGKYCAILMGDTRKNKMYIPLASNVMQRFLNVGFALKENIIKVQHNCKATGFWVNRSKEYNFLLIKHENLFVFKKVKKSS